MTKTPRAAKKLEHARFFFQHAKLENQKVIGKDRSVIEACVSACIGAVQSAFYRLRDEIGAGFEAKHKTWRKSLTQDELAFLNRMIKLRDMDVHIDDIALSAKVSAIPAHLVPGVTVFPGPLRAGVLNPITGGQPSVAPSLVTFQKYSLVGDEAASTCEKFLTLMGRLVEYCQE